MYGIKGIDHLCRPGQLRRVLAGSYPSGGSKLDPPLIRELIHTDQIEALNIPSGVLFQMHRAASTGQPGVLTAVGLGTYADPRIEGAKMNAVTDDFIQLMKVNGNEYLFYSAVNVDVAIIRATTADLYGNLSYEEECSTLGALDQAYAAHNNGGIVIAQVKRLSDTQLATQAVHIPGILVDAIVLDPDQMQTTQTFYDPALSGQIHRDFDDIEPVEFGLEKVIARRAAAELQVNAAGGKDWSPLVHMPVGFTKLGGPRYNWEFSTVPQPQLNNRQMWYPQGRTLGGSTSINAMIYIRGQKEDYEAWAELGNKHWGYEQVLPFFRHAEANERLNDRYHSGEGAVNVTEQVQHNPLSKAFVRAAQELGVPFIADFNGAVQEGVSWYDVTQKNARRESTATAYLKPIRSRKNFTVVSHALGRKIIVRNCRVTGLDMLINGRPEHVQVDRELILSGGAINSPRLMLLSGIGPAEELRQLGILVVHDLPGVGKNLQDHMDVYLTAETIPVSYNESDRPDKAAIAGLQYITTRTGPITASVCEAGMFVRSGADVATPDIQMHALPAYVIDHGRMRVKGHGMTINTCHLRPRSIGSVTLHTANPDDSPAIDPAFLTDPYDWEKSLEGFRWGREMMRTKTYQPFVIKEYLPSADVKTDSEIREYVKQWAKTDYHPVGSCKMGDDDLAVVDQELKVRGMEGLRVIDASIMPKLISGNTMATSTMIGEKGAHHVLRGLTPPDPSDGPL